MRDALRLRSDVSGLRARDPSVRGAQKVPENPAPYAAPPRCGARREQEPCRGSGGGVARSSAVLGPGGREGQTGSHGLGGRGDGGKASEKYGWRGARSRSPGPARGLASAEPRKGTFGRLQKTETPFKDSLLLSQ